MSTTDSVETIAADVGYDSATAFGKAFRKHFGEPQVVIGNPRLRLGNLVTSLETGCKTQLQDTPPIAEG